jgi:MarR family transcriptional regulator, transcriptional regulator for hemolysin
MRAGGRALSESVTGQAAVLSELVAAFLESAIESSGLSLGAFELLSAVKANPSSSQAELASGLGITPSSLCEAVRSAAQKGFVEQETSEKDRRSKRIVLTRKGAKALEAALQALDQAESIAIQGLSVGRLSAAVEVLRQSARNLNEALSGQA